MNYHKTCIVCIFWLDRKKHLIPLLIRVLHLDLEKEKAPMLISGSGQESCL